jgi:hypothetical protein
MRAKGGPSSRTAVAMVFKRAKRARVSAVTRTSTILRFRRDGAE